MTRDILLFSVALCLSFWISFGRSGGQQLRDEGKGQREVEHRIAGVAASPVVRPRPSRKRDTVGELPALRAAIRRRDHLESEVGDMRILRRMANVRQAGEMLPPTVPNCMHTTQALEGCKDAYEDEESLRYLAMCNILKYDIPPHLFRPEEVDAVPPWERLELDEGQTEELRVREREYTAKLNSLFDAAYAEATGEARGDLGYREAFRRIISTTQGKDASWGAGEGARVLLGELDAADLENFPPIPRLYAEMARAGSVYEGDLATVVGARDARRLRSEEAGWGAKGVSLGGGEAEECGRVDFPPGF